MVLIQTYYYLVLCFSGYIFHHNNQNKNVELNIHNRVKITRKFYG